VWSQEARSIYVFQLGTHGDYFVPLKVVFFFWAQIRFSAWIRHVKLFIHGDAA
jgi:hypothetical protein